MSKENHLKGIRKELLLYIEDRLQLFRLESIDHSTNFLSFIIGSFMILSIILLFLISFGFFVGLWLGDLLNNPWAGFAIISGVYLIGLIICALKFKTIIQRPIQNKLIKEIDEYEQEKDS